MFTDKLQIRCGIILLRHFSIILASLSRAPSTSQTSDVSWKFDQSNGTKVPISVQSILSMVSREASLFHACFSTGDWLFSEWLWLIVGDSLLGELPQSWAIVATRQIPLSGASIYEHWWDRGDWYSCQVFGLSAQRPETLSSMSLRASLENPQFLALCSASSSTHWTEILISCYRFYYCHLVTSIFVQLADDPWGKYIGLLPEDWCELEPLDQRVYARFRKKRADQRAKRSDTRLSPEALLREEWNFRSSS